MSDSIDAVFTWVDGSAPDHQKKREKYAADGTITGTHQRATSATRFSDQGELFYSVSLARKNAPWLRNIYIVTDSQVPSWLTQDMAMDLNLHIIDHASIFRGYENYLPTFNSKSIEAMIHRIPNLSSRFVYFNDDCFIMKPVSETDYFLGKQPVFRGKWQWSSQVVKRAISLARKLTMTKKRGTEGPDGLVGKSAEVDMMGLWRYFALGHVPHPIDKDYYASLFKDSFVKDIIRYRFRNINQIWPIGYYANHLISKGRARLLIDDWNYIDPRYINSTNPANFSILTQPQQHLCIQSMDQLPGDVRVELLDQLEKLIKVP